MNPYTIKNRIVAGILLISIFFQNCTYGIATYDAKRKAEQIVDDYEKNIPRYDQAEIFRKEVSPVIKQKISQISSEEEQVAIVQKILYRGIYSPEILMKYHPKDWIFESIKEYSNSIIEKVGGSNILTPEVSQMLVSLCVEFIEDFDIFQLISTISKKYTTKN